MRQNNFNSFRNGIYAAVALGILSVTPLAYAASNSAEYLSISNRHIVQISHKSPVNIFNIERLNKVVVKFDKAKKKDFEDFVSNRLEHKAIKSFSVSESEPLTIEIVYNKDYKFVSTDDGGVANLTFVRKKIEPVSMIRYSVDKLKFFDGEKYTKVRFYGENIENSDFSVKSEKDGEVVVIFPNTDINDAHDSLVGSKYISSVKTTENPDRAEFLFGLPFSQKREHQIVKGKNFVDLIIGEGLNKDITDFYEVQDVSFSASGNIAKISIKSSIRNPNISYDERQDSTIIRVKNATIGHDKEIRYDVSEFATPLTGFDVSTEGDDVLITVGERKDYHLAYSQFRELSEFTFEPMSEARKRGASGKTDVFEYTGDKISLDFSKVSVRNAISMIARTNNMNFVIEDNVKGNMTLVLNDVPWDQALDLILRSNRLGKEVEGNVIRIATSESLAAEYEERAKIEKGKISIEPLVTEYIKLRYKKAVDVKSVFDTVIKASSTTGTKTADTTGRSDAATQQSGGNGILSSRGTIMVDVEKNILIVRDTRSSINDIKRMIAEIDVQPKQVMIEARIVEASDDFAREFGVRFGGTFNKAKNGRGISVGAPNGVTAGNFDNLAVAGPYTHTNMVNLPAAIGAGAGGGIGISAGMIAGSVLDLELSAAESNGEIKIVSKPRVLVIDGKSANINQGTDIPFTTVSQNGTQTKFKKANLGLIVTPDFKGDNQIQLHVLATKDSPSASSVGNNPIISTKQIESDILVNNGETIVIGGIYTDTKNDTKAKVPGLGDIPILGNLFKTKKKVHGRTELLIFITTKVVDSDTELPVELSGNEG